ncbi:MAG: homocysteine S-methyltransferase family protein [Atopobiaceae bacterium]
MAELDADDEAAQSLSELLAPDGKGTLVFPGDIRYILSEFPSGDEVTDGEWIMFEQETVAHAHRLYHDVGADVAVTFTERCSAPTLAAEDTGIRMEDVCSRAVRLAFRSASPFVVGALGPSCLDDAKSEDEAVRAYEDEARCLISKGVHGILLSSMPDLAHLRAAAKGAGYAAIARELGAYRPVIGSVTLDSGHNLADGTSVFDAIAEAGKLGLATLGVEGLDAVGACALSDRLTEAAAEAGVSLLVRISDTTDRAARTDRSRLDNMHAVATAVADLARAGIRLVGPGKGAGPEMAGVMADTYDQLDL